ncbi:GNAT family N-acetyltransferase [Consotaella aegiceratis]|uniref:GNAT family N-acetyltransferase n=1 Tax=Consotaella aegiceratis TaxID=3097961 RepID=UPI002F413ED4
MPPMSSPPSIATRPGRAADAAELTELLNAVIRRGGTTAMEEAFSPAGFREHFIDGPDLACCVVAVSIQDGRLVGFQAVCRHPELPAGWGDIATFADQDKKIPGVGAALFSETRERAHGLGLEAINATIRADNTGGLAYYSKMGFVDYKTDRAVPLADGTPVDRISKVFRLG